MRRHLLLSFALLLLLVTSSAGADTGQEEAFAAMRERLERQPLLRADFRQERNLQILQRPLKSSGRMVLREGDGILWRVEEPHAVTYLIRSSEMLEWDGGDTPQRTATASVPAFRLMTEMFLAALAGDPTALQEGFRAELLPADQGWRLRLSPKSEHLAGLITDLEVAGDRYVEEVHLQEAKGDAVTFYFSNFKTEPAELDATEETYFAH